MFDGADLGVGLGLALPSFWVPNSELASVRPNASLGRDASVVFAFIVQVLALHKPAQDPTCLRFVFIHGSLNKVCLSANPFCHAFEPPRITIVTACPWTSGLIFSVGVFTVARFLLKTWLVLAQTFVLPGKNVSLRAGPVERS